MLCAVYQKRMHASMNNRDRFVVLLRREREASMTNRRQCMNTINYFITKDDVQDGVRARYRIQGKTCVKSKQGGVAGIRNRNRQTYDCKYCPMEIEGYAYQKLDTMYQKEKRCPETREFRCIFYRSTYGRTYVAQVLINPGPTLVSAIKMKRKQIKYRVQKREETLEQ